MIPIDTLHQEDQRSPANPYGSVAFAAHADDAREILWKHAGYPVDPPWPKGAEKASIKLCEIAVCEALFQARPGPRGAGGEGGFKPFRDRSHVSELIRQLSRRDGDPLAPVDVFWSGREIVLINGHHRLAAYRNHSAWGDDARIPVTIHQSSDIEQHVAFALDVNSRVHLDMSNEDRREYVWRQQGRSGGSRRILRRSRVRSSD